MSKSLKNALDQGPWSISAVMSDLNAMLDDEGRPIAERRADAVVRADVEMEMKHCPFSGIRKDKWMNVSALEQITHYLNPVLEEMAAFRHFDKGNKASWDEVLATVIDQLAGPAIYLLQQRSLHGPVPARVAVGHKLAAGMFGVIRGVCERRALGNELPVSVDTFMDLIEETGALVGATYEACAGSIPMIRKACTALIEGNPDNPHEIDPLRRDLAHRLALQVQLGVFWRLYDQRHLWSLLKDDFREDLVPANQFLSEKLKHAANELENTAPQRPDTDKLPETLDAQQRFRFAAALNETVDPELLEEDLSTATELLNEPGSAIRYNGDTTRLARCLANYLHTYRTFEAELSKIELELRNLLGFPAESSIRLGTAAFPLAESLAWYELILGRRLGEDGHLTGNSTGVRVTV